MDFSIHQEINRLNEQYTNIITKKADHPKEKSEVTEPSSGLSPEVVDPKRNKFDKQTEQIFSKVIIAQINKDLRRRDNEEA